MEVPASGLGASGPERVLANPIAPPAHLPPSFVRHSPAAADSIATLLSELSRSDLTRLLKIVEAPVPAADLARAGDLLDAATQALVSHDSGRALDLIGHLVRLDPARAETLSSVPELALIRPAVEQLLLQTAAGARLHAQSRLAEATQKLEIGNFKFNGEVRPEIFLSVAGRLLEAGGLTNCVRSAAVSSALLDQGGWVPAQVFEPAPVDLPSSGWHLSLNLVTSLWFSLGIVAIGLCWWLRSDYLSILCASWAIGVLLLTLARYWLRPRS